MYWLHIYKSVSISRHLLIPVPGAYVVYKYTDSDNAHLQHGTHTPLGATTIIFDAVTVGAHECPKTVGGPSLICIAVSSQHLVFHGAHIEHGQLYVLVGLS